MNITKEQLAQEVNTLNEVLQGEDSQRVPFFSISYDCGVRLESRTGSSIGSPRGTKREIHAYIVAMINALVLKSALDTARQDRSV
jgi:hypothetical protein